MVALLLNLIDNSGNIIQKLHTQYNLKGTRIPTTYFKLNDKWLLFLNVIRIKLTKKEIQLK